MTKNNDTLNNRKPLLQVQDVSVSFAIPKGRKWPWQPIPELKAVDRVSFDLAAGETLGIVGESGCGKSTLARAMIGLEKVSSGNIIWKERNIAGLTSKAFIDVRRDMQMIFQDPLASLNPRMTIGDIIAEPLFNYHPELSHDQVKSKVREIMDRVGLLPNVINRYPHEFSGEQCQRVGIARALIQQPQLVICDEPVSALDVSIQAQVINLLKELQQEMGLSLIFIAHDLSVVKHISDRVLVMYLSKEAELATAEELYANPEHGCVADNIWRTNAPITGFPMGLMISRSYKNYVMPTSHRLIQKCRKYRGCSPSTIADNTAPEHPYTQALLSAVPIPDPNLERNKTIQLLEGDLPSPISPPSGCVFRTRCMKAEGCCVEQKPHLQGSETHQVSCLLV